LEFHGILKDFLKMKKSCGIQSGQSWLFVQDNEIRWVFKWDFGWLKNYPLIFKSIQILMDSFMEWILWDF